MFLQLIEKVPSPGEIRRKWGYVTNAYVALQQRRQGIGRKLLDNLIDAARTQQLEFLIVWPSEEAVSLYRRAGFSDVVEVHRCDDVPPLELAL